MLFRSGVAPASCASMLPGSARLHKRVTFIVNHSQRSCPRAKMLALGRPWFRRARLSAAVRGRSPTFAVLLRPRSCSLSSAAASLIRGPAVALACFASGAFWHGGHRAGLSAKSAQHGPRTVSAHRIATSPAAVLADCVRFALSTDADRCPAHLHPRFCAASLAAALGLRVTSRTRAAARIALLTKSAVGIAAPAGPFALASASSASASAGAALAATAAWARAADALGIASK